MSAAHARRIADARAGAETPATQRARRGLGALIEAERARGTSPETIEQALSSGAAAVQIARIGLSAARPAGLACAEGCAFCCILPGEDGGTISESEARALHAALAPLAGKPDGRRWHPKACPALDPETRACRAYDARPTICRAYVSTDADACAAVAEGEPRPGPGTLSPYHDYLAALALARAGLKGRARVATYALSRVAAAAVEGLDETAALRAARHKPAALDAELKRSRRDQARAAGLP